VGGRWGGNVIDPKSAVQRCPVSAGMKEGKKERGREEKKMTPARNSGKDRERALFAITSSKERKKGKKK